jgi:hypothetical protein
MHVYHDVVSVLQDSSESTISCDVLHAQRITAERGSVDLISLSANLLGETVRPCRYLNVVAHVTQ